MTRPGAYGALLRAVIASTALIAAAPPASPLYRAGLRAFLDPRYTAVVLPLDRVWDQPGGRRSDVGYMLGASLCRIGNQDWGRSWLDHTLKNFSLSPRDRATVVGQRSACRSALAAAPAPVFEDYAFTGELLYTGVNKQTLARPIRPIAASGRPDYAARRVPLGQVALAQAGASRLATLIKPQTDRTQGCVWTNHAFAKVSGRYRFISLWPLQQAYADAMRDSLDSYLAQLQTQLGLSPPESYITLYLMACPDSIAAVARDIHGLTVDAAQMAGYSVDDDVSLVATWDGMQPKGDADSPTRRTLRHELFHLLAHRSFGDIPQWLDEGLAQYFALIGARGPQLAATSFEPVQWGALPDLADVLANPWLAADAPDPRAATQPAVPISQVMMNADVARMFLAWIDARGQLGALFTAFRQRDPARSDAPDQQPAAIVARVSKQPFDEVDAGWRNFATICRYTSAGRGWAVTPDSPAKCTDPAVAAQPR